MNKIVNKWYYALVMIATLGLFTACNKELPEAVPLAAQAPADSQTILQKLDAADYSILKTAVEKASTFNSSTGKLSDVLANPTGELTFFAPDNTAILTAFSILGLPANASSLNFFSAGKLDTLLKYHIVGGQKFTTNLFTYTHPNTNLYLQSALVLAPPSPTVPPGLRMSIFLGKLGSTGFVNNVPIRTPDIIAANGVMHKVALVLLPPEQLLWQKIASDSVNYSYFKAAVIKADGVDSTLQKAMKNPSANLTIFAPTNAAFKATLKPQIKAALIASGMSESNAESTAESWSSTPDVFNNPNLASVLTQQTVKGLIVYHIMGKRMFSVNMPTTATSFPTLLNGAVATHPGVAIAATFGASGVTAATVKGIANASASNVHINPLPNGTSDQHFINGVIHRIDQVLRPQ